MKRTTRSSGSPDDAPGRSSSRSKSKQRPAPTADNTVPVKSHSIAKSMAILLVLFLVASCLLHLLYRRLPSMDAHHAKQLKLPRSIEDAMKLHHVISHYIHEHYTTVAMIYMATYTYIQSFAIPGSIPMAVLGGALFETWTALAMVCMCTGVGATCCYLISWTCGQELMERYQSTRMQWWRSKMKHHQHDLIQYIFVLRLTPIFPGWFLNVAAAHVGIPLHQFILGTVMGILPTTFIYAEAGETLKRLSAGSHNDGDDGHPIQIFSKTNVIALFAIAALVLAPTVLAKFKKMA